jgi:hypothetical protein
LPDGTFPHNTSGFVKRKLGPKDKVEDPNSDGDGDVMDTGEEMEDADCGEGRAECSGD